MQEIILGMLIMVSRDNNLELKNGVCLFIYLF
jgi:hypothetical protein